MRHPVTITPLQESTTGPCAGCGDVTHTVRGEAAVAGTRRAVYHVRWSPRHLDGHAEWLLDLGEGSEQPREARRAVALRLRSVGRWPGFMVVDPAPPMWGDVLDASGRALARDEVVGQLPGRQAFAIVEQVMVHDPRVAALVRAMIAAEPSRWRRWLAARRGGGGQPTRDCAHAASAPAAQPLPAVPALQVVPDPAAVARFVAGVEALSPEAWRTLHARGPATAPWPLALASQLRRLWPTWRASRHWPGLVTPQAQLREAFARLDPVFARAQASERAQYAVWLAFVAVSERRAMPEATFRAYYRAMQPVIPAA